MVGQSGKGGRGRREVPRVAARGDRQEGRGERQRGVITLFAGYSVAGYANKVVELTHDRCGTSKAFGLDGEDVAASDLAVWMRDHKCPEQRVPVLRHVRNLRELIPA